MSKQVKIIGMGGHSYLEAMLLENSRWRQKVVTYGTGHKVSGRLYQIVVEIKVRLVNTVLFAGWDSSWQSDDLSSEYRCSYQQMWHAILMSTSISISYNISAVLSILISCKKFHLSPEATATATAQWVTEIIWQRDAGHQTLTEKAKSSSIVSLVQTGSQVMLIEQGEATHLSIWWQCLANVSRVIRSPASIFTVCYFTDSHCLVTQR